MRMEEISAIPYIEKKSMIMESCLMYKKLKLSTKYFNARKLKLSDYIKNNNWLKTKSASLFELILNLLSKTHLEIIENDFLNYENISRYWYEERYSKTTYYRLKHEAIDKFLFLLFT